MAHFYDSQSSDSTLPLDSLDGLEDLSLNRSTSSSVLPPQLTSYNSPAQDAAPAIPSNYEPPLTLFSIERDADPAIQWFMYYDFMVTKTEAYYQLQPGYLSTDKYPLRLNSEKVILPSGKKGHPCGVTNCNAMPFIRHYDLERHFATIHKSVEKRHMNCDYEECPHRVLFRKDHCREHYREYHSEDLIERGLPKSSKAKHSKKRPESAEEFLASRIKKFPLTWWRCSKCVQRVWLDTNGYTCPTCQEPCESERFAWREKARKSAASGAGGGASLAESTLPFFAPLTEDMSSCGYCENVLVPDQRDDSL